MNDQSLGKVSLSGLFWTGGSTLIKYLAHIVVSLILLRFIGPEEFGILAKATIFISFCNILLDLGFTFTIINKKALSQAEIHSYFWLVISLSLLIASGIYASSFLWESYYQDPRVGQIIRVFAIFYPISASYIIHRALLVKSLQFKKVRGRETLALLLASGFGVYFAMQGYSYWSIVYQQVLNSILAAILLWATGIYKPAWIFHLALIKENWAFSTRIFFNNMIQYFGDLLDQFIISTKFSTQTLGLYNRSNSLFNTPVGFVPKTFLMVLFPILSQSNRSEENILEIYQRVYELLMFLFFPIFLFVVFFTKDFVSFVLGPDWIEASAYVQGFCILALFVIVNIEKSILLSFSRADRVLTLTYFQQILNISAIIIGAFYSPLHILYGRVIAGAINRCISIIFMQRWYQFNSIEYMKSLLRFSLVPLVILSLGYYIYTFLPWKMPVNLLFVALVSSLIYMVWSMLGKWSVIIDTKRILQYLRP